MATKKSAVAVAVASAINAHEVTDFFLSEAAGAELIKLGQADVRVQRQLKAWGNSYRNSERFWLGGMGGN